MSRIQDDAASGAHFAGAPAGTYYKDEEECEYSYSDTSDDDTYSDSSSDDDGDNVHAHCTRRTEYSSGKAKTAGDHYCRDHDHDHDPTHPPRSVERRMRDPAYSVAAGTAGTLANAGMTVIDAATLNFGAAAEDAVDTAGYATQAGTLGVVQYGAGKAEGSVPGAKKQAGAPFMETCYIGPKCNGCTHPACPTKKAGARAPLAEQPAKRAGAPERTVWLVDRDRERSNAAKCGGCKKAGCNECGGHKKARGHKKSHMSYAKAGDRERTERRYELRGSHSDGKCLTCYEGVRKAGSRCPCGNLRSVKV
jgi:hypothetical protein